MARGTALLLAAALPAGPLDLPKGGLRPLRVAVATETAGVCVPLPAALEAWSEALAAKRSFERVLGSGRTVPAPLVRGPEGRVLLLFPSSGRLDLPTAPVGVLLQFGLGRRSARRSAAP